MASSHTEVSKVVQLHRLQWLSRPGPDFNLLMEEMGWYRSEFRFLSARQWQSGVHVKQQCERGTECVGLHRHFWQRRTAQVWLLWSIIKTCFCCLLWVLTLASHFKLNQELQLNWTIWNLSSVKLNSKDLTCNKKQLEGTNRFLHRVHMFKSLSAWVISQVWKGFASKICSDYCKYDSI